MQARTPSSRAIIILILISIPIFIGALDLTVVSAVLPHVLVDFEIPLQTSLDDAAWIVTGYLLAYTVSMTFMGRLSDLYGRQKVFLAALGIFALGSYLVAVADTWPTRMVLRTYYMLASGRPDPSLISLWNLIAARVIQAIGAGAMVPVGMALVGDLYPPGRRARALGFIAAVDTAGWVVGHLYGGIVARFWDWRMIFWFNLPVCLLAFLLIWFLLRGVGQPRGEGRMDWLGALLITTSLSALILGLGTGAELSGSTGFEDQTALPPYAFPAMIVAILLLGLFIWRQLSAKHPLIPLTLFRTPNFSPASLANFFVGFSLFIAIANVPLFINLLIADTIEQGAWDSGWMLSALTVPMALIAVPGGWLTEKIGYRWPSAIGLLAAIVAFSLMMGWKSTTLYGTMIPQLVLAGLGFGLTLAPIASAVVDASPSEHRGTGSALVIIFRLIGMTAGVSSITTYALQRADKLSNQMLSSSADLSETIRVGVQVLEKVISETFLVAAVASALAVIPILFIRTKIKQGENNE
ncbi:MAG: MFS transporter [Chloroflexi bacterium]|nr:MFS transporter [Chloroflexota bacterium]